MIGKLSGILVDKYSHVILVSMTLYQVPTKLNQKKLDFNKYKNGRIISGYISQ